MSNKFKNVQIKNYRSKLEAAFADALTKADIPFEYEPKSIVLFTPVKNPNLISVGKKLKMGPIRYTPDFCGNGWCAEIKGVFTPEARLKIKLLTLSLDFPLYIVYSKEDFEDVIRSIKENIR